MEHWPVPPWLREELNKIKFEYYAVPLTVYADNNFIEPALVNNTIRGALVELHFELHHFAIRKAVQDSFNASIEQIVILRPSEACPMTVYKRKHPHDGPILVKPTTFPAPKQIGEGSCHDSDVGTDYFSFLLYFSSHPCSLFVSSFVLNTDFLLFTHTR